jgi:hypothetical protein
MFHNYTVLNGRVNFCPKNVHSEKENTLFSGENVKNVNLAKKYDEEGGRCEKMKGEKGKIVI